MHVTAIIPAGGRGRRLGSDHPKQFLDLAGQPILRRTVDAFLRCPAVDDVIVALPADVASAPPSYLVGPRVRVVPGGERRQDSVANGFDALPPATDIVLIHDAARPLVDQGTIERAIAAAAEAGAAIVALGASDTIKLAAPGGGRSGARFVERTISRDTIFLAQTPQAFRRSVLGDAIALGRRGVEATDEAALAEQAGHRVQLVEGSPRNIKITAPDDLVIAEALIADARSAEAPSRSRRGGDDMPKEDVVHRLRVGSGYDLHRLVEGRPLVLGGVTVPYDKGLDGHSDADVLCHAITDALLGAASLGDIGQHFPDTDPRWKGAVSTELLAQAAALLREGGYTVVNVDATVIAERPRLGAHRAAIVARLSQVLGLDAGAVSVKAKTNEGLDATGRGEAIAVHAIALVQRRTAVSRQQTAESGQPGEQG